MTDADRPIQAGDWVECVDNGSRRDRLTVGARYQVERVRGDALMARPQLDLYGVESPVFGWCLSRFKRVDGPHPETATIVTGNAQSSVAGEAPKRDPYTEHRLALDCYSRATTDSHERNVAARKRMDRAEKPRVTNRAQQKQMAAGHPASWPSNEGEE